MTHNKDIPKRQDHRTVYQKKERKKEREIEKGGSGNAYISLIS